MHSQLFLIWLNLQISHVQEDKLRRNLLLQHWNLWRNSVDVLGLIVEKKEEILDEEIEKLIAERQAAERTKISQEQMRSEDCFWKRESN